MGWSRRAVSVVCAVTVTAAGLVVATPRPAVADPPTTVTFAYTGAVQSWTVPAGVTAIRVVADGAQGGAGAKGGGGGLGARVEATVPVTPGEALKIYVGGQGKSWSALGAGGFNGGGSSIDQSYPGGGGGGASDLRQGGTALSNRVVVAAGGGGASRLATPALGAGGSGGAASGDPGTAGENGAMAGGGGSATAGGAGGAGSTTSPAHAAGSGSLGQGGNIINFGGGGGGGYYGGGAGGAATTGAPGGGGGGSSWTAPAASGVASRRGFRPGDGKLTITYPASTPDPDTPTPGTASFAYTGAVQSWTVPVGVTAIRVVADGAQGGAGARGGGGGLGGRIEATVPVTPGETLEIYVGGQGKSWSALGAGGFNGGGASVDQSYPGGGGGGATDIRQGGVRPEDRVVVAAGGGGATRLASPTLGAGGSGGGSSGDPGTTGENGAAGGGGGTATAGGAAGAGSSTSPAHPASPGFFAQGGSIVNFGGGGGGGYYGGGAGGAPTTGVAAGGGGGSSWTAPAVAGVVSRRGFHPGDGQLTITWPPALPAPGGTVTASSATFAYTGALQSWTAPAGVNAVSIAADGAQGGAAGVSGVGGRGGHVTAVVAVAPGEALGIYVGGQGKSSALLGAGGFNGGGSSVDQSYPGAGGGGATDVRQGGVRPEDRIVVAGGGGGASRYATSVLGSGGAGGGSAGSAGWAGENGATGGGGGTQTAGGAGGAGSTTPPANAAGAGSVAQGGSIVNFGGGGGGGYYGGGAGGVPTTGVPGGGGGGSTYVTPYAFEGTTTPDSRTGDGTVTISWPAPVPAERSFGADSYGDYVNHVHIGSGNLVEQATDVTIAAPGPDLALERTYNSLDTATGMFGTGWTTGFDEHASLDGATGVVTIVYPDGRREPHYPQPGGTFKDPPGYVSTLTAAGGGGWVLHHKDHSTDTFNASGQLTATSDRDGRQLTLTYTAGRLTSVAEPASGRSLTVTYTGALVTSVSTSSVSGPGYSGSLTWNYAYSGNLLTKACDPRDNDTTTGDCTVYEYTSGRLTGIKRPKGNYELKAGYRTDGRVDWTEDGVGDHLGYAYGPGLTQITDARGNATDYFYDGDYRTTDVVDGLLGATRYEYDGNGFRSKVTDPAGHVATMSYDARGNLVSQTDATGATTWSTYDGNDNLIAQRDARSSGPTDDRFKTTYTYNSAGDELTETSPATAEYPAGITQTLTYTAGGENFGWGAVPPGLPRTMSDSRGTTTYDYDSTGDVRRQTDAAGLVTTFDHDALGRVTAKTTTWATGQSATMTQTWDQIGDLLTVTDPATSDTTQTPAIAHQRQTVNDYDGNGNRWRTTVHDAGGSAQPTPDRVTTVDFDDADRPFRTTDPEGGVTSKTFDANGNVRTSTDANGHTYQADHDALNRVTAITLLGFVDDPVAGSTPRDVVLKRYGYDAASRKTNEFDPAPGTGGRTGQLDPAATPMVERAYAYDNADRLLSSTLIGYHNRAGVTPATRDVVLEAGTYDPAGNVLSRSTGGGLSVVTNTYDEAGRLQTATLEMGAADRVTDFDYDVAGNPTRVTTTQGSSMTETRNGYDTAGRLVTHTVENGTDDLVTTYAYDNRGLRTSTVDPRGNVTGADPDDFRTTNTYDAVGQLVAITAPAVSVEATGGTAVSAQPTTRFGYDAAGNLTTTVDPRGHATTVAFDRLDRRTRVDQPAYTPPGASAINAFETYTYDPVGNLTATQDRRGQVTDFTFDARNRVVRRLDPHVTGTTGRGATLTTYDDAGNTETVTDPTGALSADTHDDLARVRTHSVTVRQAAPAGTFTTSYDYDDLGNATLAQDPTGVTTTRSYDAASELTAVTDALGKTTHYDYDAAGRRTAAQDPLGRRTEHLYDPAGRDLETITKDANTSTTLAVDYRGYDPAGNEISARSARAASATDTTYLTTYAYDAVNHVTAVTEPDAAGAIITTAGYDAAGNTTRLTDGLGHDTTSTYTPWNTLESTVEPATPGQTAAADRTFTTTYDAGGLPVTEQRPGVTISRTYDELGRLSTESGSGTGVPSATNTFGYDAAGRTTTIGHPDGTITVTYDDRGLPLAASQPGSATPQSQFQYDAAGRLTSRSDAAGTTAFTYTARGELDHLTDPLTGLTEDWGWNDAGQPATVAYTTTPAATRTYTYDSRGRLQSDVLATGTTVLDEQDYGYDADNDVTAQTVTAPGNPAAGANTYTYDRSGRLASWTDPASTTTNYSYDAAGNRTAAGSTTYTYDARNRLSTAGTTTYEWSPRGTITAVDDGTAVTDVTFDALDRQTAWGDTTYAYDSLGRAAARTTSAGTTAFTYDATAADPASYGSELFARTPGGDLTALEVGGAARLTGDTRHGDLAWLLAANGTVTDTRVWDPYGAVAGATGSTDPDVGYQGDFTDPNSGQADMGARWYQPGTGTFTARDTTAGQLRTPMSLNRYTYANGDPVENFDPDGHSIAMRDGGGGDSAYFPTESGQFVVMKIGSPEQKASSARSLAQAKAATKARTERLNVMQKQMGATIRRDFEENFADGLPAGWDAMSFEQQISYWMTSRIRALHLPVTAKEWDNATLETKIRMFGRLGDEKWATRTESCAGVKLICDHRAGLMQIGIGGLALAGGMLTGGLASAAVAGVLPETAATALVSAGAGGFAGGTTISGISQLLTTGHVDVGQALKQGAVGGVLAVATAGLGLGVQGAFRGVMARVAAGAADSEVVAGARLPQDVAVDPTAPRALPLDRPVGLSDTQNEFAQSRIGSLQEQGATDFRVNQQQVDMNGARVGVNRPDLQYTLNGQRYYEEFDRFSSWRGFEHQARIYANDPSGIVNLFWVE